MGEAVFALLIGASGLGFGAILVLGALQLSSGRIEFWPPPSAQSWQHKWFRGLFRAGLYPLVAASVLLLMRTETTAVGAKELVGASLVLLGFGAAFWATAQMGWRNAFGEARGLETTGWFALSRNPVYVATLLGLAGWALAFWNLWLCIPLALWAALYLIAPLLEEPWLEAEYGAEFRDYKSRVRRFL